MSSWIPSWPFNFTKNSSQLLSDFGGLDEEPLEETKKQTITILITMHGNDIIDDRNKFEENLEEEKVSRTPEIGVSEKGMNRSIDLLKKLNHYLDK